MDSPHSWSRRQFLATSGLSLLPTLQQSSAESSAPSLTWSNLYSGDQTAFGDIAPAHEDGWVAVGQDAKNYNTLIVSVATDGRARWQKIRSDVPLREARSIVQRDEGYAVAGIADGNDDQNIGPYLTLVDTQGTIETTTVVDTIGDLQSIELSQTAQGGYIFTGVFRTPDRHSPIVCGFDSTGRHQWTRRYQDRSKSYQFGFMLQRSDDSYRIGGARGHEGNLWLAELTADGDERSMNTVSTSWWLDAGGAVHGPESGLLIAGYDHSAEETILLRLTPEKDIEWVRRYDFSESVLAFERTDDRYIIASSNFETEADLLRLTRVNADGDLLWTRVYDVERTRALLNQGADGLVLAGPPDFVSETAWVAKISDSPMQSAVTRNTSAIPNSTAATLHGQNTSATNSSESTQDTTPGFGLLTATTGIAAVLWKYYLEETE